MRKPTILIVGAGLGGAALAHGLKAKGFDVRLLDRDLGPGSHEQGYRISINRTGLDALRALLPAELTSKVLALEPANVGRCFTFASGRMKPLMRFDDTDGGAMTVNRARLRGLLTEDLPVQWDRTVVDVHDTTNGIAARLSDGDTVRGALLVGCDGANSAVRKCFPSDTAPRATAMGVTNVAGSVDRSAAWDRALSLNLDGAVQYLGPQGRALFVSFCDRSDGSPSVLWALSGRFTGRPDAAAELRSDGWHRHLRELIDATPPAGLHKPMTFATTKMPRHTGTA
jgi:2-polyprenyl-6-methoxyphenol hydroxylase-like FAD-dependent oxidoreductase